MTLTIEDRKELDASMERTLIRLLDRHSSIAEAFARAIERGYERTRPAQVKELSDALLATITNTLEAKVSAALGAGVNHLIEVVAGLQEAVDQLGIDLAALGVDEEEPVEGGGSGGSGPGSPGAEG